jgi:regulator of sirC expression with transglutaminase-like and TPR domain
MKEKSLPAMDFLIELGKSGEGPHDIALAALTLSALDHADRPLAFYQSHLAEMGTAAKAEAIYARDAEAAGRVLAGVLAGHYGYDGDRLNFDDPRNADLISVIDRRRGIPVTLGILYIHAARAGGLSACGLMAPGHFLLMIGLRGTEAIVDPFNAGAVLDRERLVQAPALAAPGVPQETRIFEPVSDTDVLLRLQSVLKARAIAAGEAERSLQIAERMAIIAPKHADVWVELAHMREAAGAMGAARAAYENCLTLAKKGEPLHKEALLALSGLKRKVN